MNYNGYELSLECDKCGEELTPEKLKKVNDDIILTFICSCGHTWQDVFAYSETR